jgi:hypothetical protein
MDIATSLQPVPSYFTECQLSSQSYPIMMHREQHVMKILFSVYVGEVFSYYVPAEWLHRSESTHTMMALQVQPEELAKAWEYVMDLCNAKVPYNMTDLMLCCMPSMVTRDLLYDVDTRKKIPSKVFCSQVSLPLSSSFFIVHVSS